MTLSWSSGRNVDPGDGVVAVEVHVSDPEEPLRVDAVLRECRVEACGRIPVKSLDSPAGHCCVAGLGWTREWRGDFFCIDVCLHRVSVPPRGDLGRGPVVPALWPVLP